MNRQEFKDYISTKPVFLDGATGSNLQKLGMPPGVCPEKWIVENREVMIELQKQYVEAGSDIIYAATFSGNIIKLREYGIENEIEYLNKELVRISQEAADNKALVAGDVTMTGEQLVPMGTLTFEELVDIYKEQMGYLVEAGVDMLVIETMMSLQETRAAVIAAREICDLPVMVSLTFNEDGRTLYGTDPATAVVVLQGLGADAVGVNCSSGPDKMVNIIEIMKEYATVPIIAKPNAGLPFLDENGESAFDMDEEEFVKNMVNLVKAGANIVGGCCGTTPAYIKALYEAVGDMETLPPRKTKSRALASERQTLPIDLQGQTLIVGEKINPTGKKKLQEELRNNIYDIVLSYAEDQAKFGASVLDVNVGMSGINEKETMLKVVEEITGNVNIPLCIDTSFPEVMEAALRVYPGRALINSISLEKGKADLLLPLAKKYGAMFVLLPLGDKGLPKSLEERKSNINAVIDKALAIGLTKEDIVVDGLVATIGANKNAAIETLETIKYCFKELQVATIMGLSNISFGLPERNYVNSTFLTMAIQNGATMAIADPFNHMLMKCLFASDLLMNKEEADMRYIEAIASRKGEPAIPNAGIRTAVSANNEKNNISVKNTIDITAKENSLAHNQVYIEIVKGARKNIVETVKSYMQQGHKPSDILDSMLIPGINKVSELFEQKKYFLPQLIASAEAMKKAIEYLEPYLFNAENPVKKPTVIMATVEGDIHDIGKNLVSMMLKNYGYNVIDLGKDVKKELIVETAIAENASIIGLSALMTTTMQEMKNVIVHAKEKGCKSKIIIGGAVITEAYAKEIGADGYSKDASEAVVLVNRLLSEKMD